MYTLENCQLLQNASNEKWEAVDKDNTVGYYTFSRSIISGISFIVPKDEICLDDEIQYYDNNSKKLARIKKMIGIDKRRVAPEGVTAADLCQQAAENMFKGMKINPQSIDTLIFVSQSPDHELPATACILQHKLGLSQECAAFDVNQGCTAYTYGLWLASTMIDSGACKRVLVLVGESGAIYSDPANRIITPIFGDSGSATLVEYSEKETFSYFAIGTDGSGAEALMVPAGHARCPITKDEAQIQELIKPTLDVNNHPWYLHDTYMNGGEVYNFTISVVPTHLQDLLKYANKPHDEIDYLVVHQANKQIAQAVSLKAGFDLHKVPTETVEKYGNQAGASLPSVICDQLSEQVSNGKIKALLAGFGVGLSWASALLELDAIWCSGIQEYEMTKTPQTREEFITYWHNKYKETGQG